jgi:acetyl esterase/lipase
MKRSFASIFSEKVLKLTGSKRHFTQKKDFVKYMERMKKKHVKPYVLPSFFSKRDDFEKCEVKGMDVYRVKGDGTNDKTKILYLHGGGYTSDPLPFHWFYILQLKACTQTDFYVPVYPKLPLYTYKDAFDKVMEVYENLLESNNAEDIVFMGDSAGGGFVLALAQLIQNKGMPGPRDIIMLSPWLDITMSNPELPEFEKTDPVLGIKGLIATGKYWAGDTDTNYYLLSPINGPLEGLGRMTLFVGTRELLCPDARRFKAIAEEKGVPLRYFEYPEMVHCFPIHPIPEAKEANEIIVKTILNEE